MSAKFVEFSFDELGCASAESCFACCYDLMSEEQGLCEYAPLRVQCETGVDACLKALNKMDALYSDYYDLCWAEYSDCLLLIEDCRIGIEAYYNRVCFVQQCGDTLEGFLRRKLSEPKPLDPWGFDESIIV